jgi:hypothetical protein
VLAFRADDIVDAQRLATLPVLQCLASFSPRLKEELAVQRSLKIWNKYSSVTLNLYMGADKSLARPGKKRLTGHLRPRRNWPTRASSVLITHPILRIWSRRTTTCSLD